MVKGCPVSAQVIKTVGKMAFDSISLRQAALKSGIPFSTFQTILRRKRLGIPVKKQGRKPVLDDRTERRIKLFVKKNRNASLRRIKTDLNLSASPNTIRQVLLRNQMRKRKFKIRPFLSPTHKEKRVNFARHHLTSQTDWGIVVFSDEKKFSLNGPDGYHSYWVCLDNDEDRILFSKDTHNKRGVMVWIAICSYGLVHIERLEGRINSERYIDIFLGGALQKMVEMMPGDFVFQQDNASVHVSKKTKDFFLQNGVTLLEHPALSPDLNPVENVWALLSRRIYMERGVYDTEDQLWEAILRCARELTPNDIAPFVNSMPGRCVSIIEKKGSYIQ